MGIINSSRRQNIGIEEVDISINHAYKYPPKSGNYFSNHFIMGGERFDTAQPEMYLFGENVDLNFLGSRPAPFPYPAPSASEPSRTLKSLVNIRKESLRFVRVPDDSHSLKEPESRSPSTQFNIEFTFDTDVRCAITIMYFCTEEVTSTGLIYTPRDPSMNSETYHYKRGANQQFSQVCHVFDPSEYPEESLLYNFDREVMPIVIFCVAEEGEEPLQCHATIAVVEKHSDGYSLKPLKQKLFVDGLCYLLQEIYGIENKNADSKPTSDDDPDDNGAECVICMCDLRDTLILPCRHLCLCNCCADSLRYQANNCPICRAPFRALLQIKALQKSGLGVSVANANNNENLDIPPGYEAVSLIEALNGPSVAPPPQPVAPPFHEIEYHDTCNPAKVLGVDDSTTQTERSAITTDSSDYASKGAATQMRMSILMAQESQEVYGEKTDEPPGPQDPHEAPIDPEDGEGPKGGISNTQKMTQESIEEGSEEESGRGFARVGSAYSLKDNKRCSSDADDVEELNETLSLLDNLSSSAVAAKPDCVGGRRSPSSLDHRDRDRLRHSDDPDEAAGAASDVVTSPRTTPGGTQSGDGGRRKGGSCSPADKKASRKAKHKSGRSRRPNPSSGSSHASGPPSGAKEPPSGARSPLSGSEELSSAKEHSPSPANEPPSGIKEPQGAREALSGVKDSSSGVKDPSSVAPETQSLPGTPLSHSSAVSRSSEASASSASSTRALIVPPPATQTQALQGARQPPRGDSF